jgi:hypothetical protein
VQAAYTGARRRTGGGFKPAAGGGFKPAAGGGCAATASIFKFRVTIPVFLRIYHKPAVNPAERLRRLK